MKIEQPKDYVEEKKPEPEYEDYPEPPKDYEEGYYED